MKKLFYLCLLACSLALLSTVIIVGCGSDDNPAVSEWMGNPISTTHQNWSNADYRSWLPKTLADHRIPYEVPYGTFSSHQFHFGDLRIPKTNALKNANGYPVMVLVHGGAWRVQSTLDQTAHLAEAFTDFGIATWNIEFRRFGASGMENRGEGGYPNTLIDVGAAIDYLNKLKTEYDLDLSRVLILCHSSGGHLGMWAASRHKLPNTEPTYVDNPLPIKGVISIGSIVNMEMAYAGGRTDIYTFLGVDDAVAAAALYPTVSPAHMLPIDVRAAHFVGEHDAAWRIDGLRLYHDNAVLNGVDSHYNLIADAEEVGLIDPCNAHWPQLVTETFWLLGEPLPARNLNYSRFCPINGRTELP